jgi:hypothetical protein
METFFANLPNDVTPAEITGTGEIQKILSMPEFVDNVKKFRLACLAVEEAGRARSAEADLPCDADE